MNLMLAIHDDTKIDNINIDPRGDNTSWDDSFYFRLKSFKDFNDVNRSNILMKPTIKFVINVRHPLARLYSAWSDKFHHHPNSMIYILKKLTKLS